MAMKNKVRRKPTAKEIASAIIEINQRIQHLGDYVTHVDKILGMYLDYTGKRTEFEDYINKLIKDNSKDDKKTDGSSDQKDLPKNPGNKRRRPKRVRKKSK